MNLASPRGAALIFAVALTSAMTEGCVSMRPTMDGRIEVMALLNQLISAQTSLKEFSRAPASVRVR